MAALTVTCLFAKTVVDYDHSVSFSKYHTYSWIAVRGWWAGGPGYATTSVERTPIGTLDIDIFDSQSKKVIWHVVYSDTLTGNPEKNEKKLNKSVADAFKKFPPPEKG